MMPNLRDLDPGAGRPGLVPTAATLGTVGVLAFSLGLAVDARQAYASYLAAYAAGLSVVLGALLIVMIIQLTGGAWFEPLRRAAEAVVGTIPAFAVLFGPILLGMPELYPWAQPTAAVSRELQVSIAAKGDYFSSFLFAARAALYFGVWLLTAHLLLRWSAEGARTRSTSAVRKQRVLSAVALPAVALALTFAAFDWLMSRAPGWYSSVYGVYWFAGGFLGALALLAVLAFAAKPEAPARVATSAGSNLALGKLLFTFVAFWAYIAYSQFFVIWIADIPAEVSWYIPRTRGSWGAVSITLIIGHFALPFLLLLSRAAKLRPAVLAAAGAWLLLMHYLDTYWLVLPELYPAGVSPHWLDLAGVLAVIGVSTWYGLWRIGTSTREASRHVSRLAGDALRV